MKDRDLHTKEFMLEGEVLLHFSMDRIDFNGYTIIRHLGALHPQPMFNYKNDDEGNVFDDDIEEDDEGYMVWRHTSGGGTYRYPSRVPCDTCWMTIGSHHHVDRTDHEEAPMAVPRFI